MKVKIRRFRASDLDQIIKIRRALSFDDDSNEKHTKKIMSSLHDSSGVVYLVAEEEGKVFGCMGYSPSKINYRVYELFDAYVDMQHQNNGIGTALMNAIIKEVNSLRREPEDDYLLLLTSLKPGYFERFGFKTLTKIEANGSCLMCLRLRPNDKN